MKYSSKDELLADIEKQYAALSELLDFVPRDRYAGAGVWGDDWSVDDLVAHLSSWHRLFLGWYRAGLDGETPEMPAPGYKWNETPRLNHAIQEKHQSRPTEELRSELEATHAEVLALARDLSEEQLLRPGAFAWTGKNAVVTYLGANTASHYRFAIKVLKRWKRQRDWGAKS